jgi:hypothetical protein
LKTVRVRLQPIANRVNLPTVIKTAVPPGDETERLFFATQIGEIFVQAGCGFNLFLDIRSLVLPLGLTAGGYDERGLLGLAFHPNFHENGLFYLYYTLAGSQGPGALQGEFIPDPCDPASLNLVWTDRQVRYDHIDTVEEWRVGVGAQPQRMRTLLNLRRPFLNHNGVNNLNFSPETGNLVLTSGDGGSGYDPFNLAQNPMEIAGKIIEIDVDNFPTIDNMPVVTRFNELPVAVQEALSLMAKGVRNIPGIAFRCVDCCYKKYIGLVGQDLVESVFSFDGYLRVPVTEVVGAPYGPSITDRRDFINFGWRGWEGAFPTTVINDCPSNPDLSTKTIAYYDNAVETSTRRIYPLTSTFHQDPRPDHFESTALTSVQPYLGNAIPGLRGNIVFTDWVRNEGVPPPARGVLAYTHPNAEMKLNDYSIIETDFDFGAQAAYYVGMGANRSQTQLYLAVYASANVADLNQGTIFAITRK